MVSVRATDHISYRAKKSGSGREWRGSGRAGGGSEFCQTFLYAPGCRGSTSKRGRGGGGGGHMFSQILRLQAGRRSAPPSDRSASRYPAQRHCSAAPVQGGHRHLQRDPEEAPQWRPVPRHRSSPHLSWGRRPGWLGQHKRQNYLTSPSKYVDV